MRCARCGRRVRRLRAGRLPDGHLAFSWCGDCVAEAHLRTLGLAPEPSPAIPPQTKAIETHTPRVAGEASDRAAGLRSLGILLSAWGLFLEVVGTSGWLGFGGTDDGLGPTLISRSCIFMASGAILAVAGAWTGLATLTRAERALSLSRSIEVALLGLCAIVLVAGIAFHHPRRDPWVVGGVILFAAGAAAARHWYRARSLRESRIASG